jgi:hypothetical protein
MQDEERIRRRAHEIWEQEGRPEGRDQEHWAQASREIEAESDGPATPDDAPTPTAADGGGATPAEAASAANAFGASHKT